MKKTLSTLILIILFTNFLSSQISTSFEFRYYTKDRAAEGITDFKGENDFFTTEQRIDFLEAYAGFAADWFLDSALDSKVNTEPEIHSFLSRLKEQPLPENRKRIRLDQWRTMGYKTGDHERSRLKAAAWDSLPGVSVERGSMHLNAPGIRINRPVDTLRWRFHLSWKALNRTGKDPFTLTLRSGNQIVAEAGFHSNGNIFFTDHGRDQMGEAYIPGKWYDFRIEADLVNDRYNLLVNGRKTGDWISMKNCSIIDNIVFSGGVGIELDHITGLNFDTTGCGRRQPYTIQPFIRETFDIKPTLQQWSHPLYDDRHWELTNLPAVRGGVLESGEDLYLRKTIRPGNFGKAWLNIEALDPGGEIWINGRVIHVTHNRYPVRLDISPFLVPYRENTIAVRIFSFYNTENLYHSPLDRNIGWFCGRAWIDLTEKIQISAVKVFTSSLDHQQAEQFHKIIVANHSESTFSGRVTIDYYPWFPVESSTKSASFSWPLEIFAHDSIHLTGRSIIKHPILWTHDNPNLYRIHIRIRQQGKVVDDEVVTTGIRTVSQEDGIFRINGEPELLGGAQIMGFRMPVENNAKWNRCAPAQVLANELLACKKLGNLLRIHVHAGGTYAHSINDPRIAEMADQMGLMLIWPTSAWIREGEWGGIDFKGYPRYMKQVFNHPCIVMWEGSNHPNRFEGKPLSYSNRFISKIYNTIADTDSSRLISPTSYNRHLIYGNDQGTIDKKGNAIIPVKEWTAPLIVRGNQDALTGYGAEWHKIRQYPDPYRRSMLNSQSRAYFNFEHEESIGMQNFELAKGQPWYQMPSYENRYDTGSIGRSFHFDEWRASQAWQAFSAWEALKWQRLQDVDGFSWCCLHEGPNSGTYRKPLIDALGHAKLSYYTNKMALQDIIAGSNNTDVVYHRKDELTPVILNLGDDQMVNLKIIVRSAEGKIVDTRLFNDIRLEKGRNIKEIAPFRPKFAEEGYYAIEYYVLTP